MLHVFSNNSTEPERVTPEGLGVEERPGRVSHRRAFSARSKRGRKLGKLGFNPLQLGSSRPFFPAEHGAKQACQKV